MAYDSWTPIETTPDDNEFVAMWFNGGVHEWWDKGFYKVHKKLWFSSDGKPLDEQAMESFVSWKHIKGPE